MIPFPPGIAVFGRLEELVPRDRDARIALRGVHIDARVSGMNVKATISQTFVNLDNQAIEAIYAFPLPENAAVCGFEVITGDRVLSGVIEESERAIEAYEEAVSEGHAAYLVDQERPDVFTARLGNLKRGQAATIRLTYVCPLERADGSIRLAFPTTVAPRYTTATCMDPIDAAIDGDALNPPHVLSVPYGLSLNLEIALGRDLRQVTSPSHLIEVASNEDGACRVRLAGGIAEMDRDVVILMELQREHEPAVQVAPGKAGESYLAVTFVPEFETEDFSGPQPSETVFVLDCSGSMQGQSIAQATAALELCLRSMSAGDAFNICRFGSTWEMMAREPLVYSQQSLDRAIRYVRHSADLGGTELHAPLEAVMSRPPTLGAVRNIILLTDGQVTNEPAILALARKHRASNRIFSFGIGSACSAHLVRGLARATGGAAEFISGGERIDDKVLRTFGRVASPLVSDVQIDWDGCDVQTLAQVPPVFDGEVLAVFGRAAARVPRRVTLKCRTPAGERSWSIEVPAPQVDGGLIATMWARRAIQSLEEVNGVRPSRSRPAKRTRDADLLINLSKEFGLLCSLTSFIAVEHRSIAERNEGRPVLKRIPVSVPAGWGALAANTCDRTIGRLFSGGPASIALANRGILARRRSTGARDVDFDCLEELGNVLSHSDIAPAPAAAPGPADELLSLLALQTADGSFGWNDSCAKLLSSLGQDPARLRSVIIARLAPSAVSDEAVNTIMVLLVLGWKFADREPVWRRASRKATREYLPKALGKTTTQVQALVKQLSEQRGAVT